ncbi:MAG: beta-ketoacyl synthase N-terminal-like domain-containing protein, partial [Acidobacteriota bacterium]
MTEGKDRIADRTWCDRGGYVRGFDERFDPAGFQLPATEIRQLDPLFQWVLHCGREALHDARVDRQRDLERTGLILGNLSFPSLSASRFAESVWLGEPVGAHNPPEVDPRNHFMSGLPAHLAARALGLGGTAFALDAACASSLVAIKLACDRLHDRRADVMLAGAVSCADDLFIHIGFCALDALSPSGRSRPFHRDADGLLPAEGAAIIALRRLSDAVERGDRILGVIRGVGLSNDGRSGGLLAPSQQGQIRAIRRAYEEAALAPRDVSLIECHATGTQLGDATELESLGQLYQDLTDVPIGSLKSNLGHPITAAGLAGLLKVIAAMRAETRPPTLHDGPANPVLEGSPFRLLTRPEPWPGEQPRIAALSAFGFGGNNAHLLIEEWREDSGRRIVAQTPEPAPKPAIAIVGVAAMAADAADTETFTRVLFDGESRLAIRPEDGRAVGRAETIELPFEGLGFPPNDLRQTLPQQLLLLATAREAIAGLTGELPKPRTGILIGMRCDAEIARYGLRWRLADWGRGLDPDWLDAARDSVVAGLQSAGVVGTMPNMTANRLNSQLNLGGASSSISSEELSGLVALDLAVRALRSGEVDAALVGAADLSCEPVHEAAIKAVLKDRIPGDAATVLVLKRLDQAERDGDRVLAVIEDTVDPVAGEESEGVILSTADRRRLDLEALFGRAHAATSLLQVAAVALALYRRTLPGRPEAQRSDANAQPSPWLSHGPRRARVTTRGLESRCAAVYLRDTPRSDRREISQLSPGEPRIHLFSGADRAEVLARLREDRADDPAMRRERPARLALVAADDAELAIRRHEAQRLLSAQSQGSASQRLPPRGVYFREAPLAGELSFVFAGAGAAYHGMGRDLLVALPELLDRLARRMKDMPAAADWVYAPEAADASLAPLQKLWGSSFLSQAHSELTRGVLGLQPAAVLGYSSGESNSLMAMGAWNDLDALHHDTYECGLFTRELGGDFEAIARRWQAEGEPGGRWNNLVLSAPVEQVRALLAKEPRAHLTLLNSPEDLVIGGDAEACQRVVDRLGVKAYPLDYDLAVHCPEVGEVAEAWLELHRRPTTEVPDIRFYSHATLNHYRPDRESAARAILGQAVRTLDFPGLVRQAWDDGVRIFLEHGPRGLCSGWIRKTLAYDGIPDGDALVVPLDRAGASLRQSVDAIAQLLTAGVEVAWDPFHARRENRPGSRKLLAFPAHWPRIEITPPGIESPAAPAPEARPNELQTLATAVQASHASTTSESEMSKPEQPQFMTPAPSLPPVLGEAAPASTVVEPAAKDLPAPDVPTHIIESAVSQPQAIPSITQPGATQPTAPLSSASMALEPPAAPPGATPAAMPLILDTEVLRGFTDLQQQITASQKSFLDSQVALHQQFLALRQRTLTDLMQIRSGFSSAAAIASLPSSPSETPAVGSPVQQPLVPSKVAPAPVASKVSSSNGKTAPLPVTIETPGSQVEPKPTVKAKPESLPEPPSALESAPRSTEAQPVSSQLEAPTTARDASATTELPGLKISRRGLEVLAAGKVSEIFGPMFERQDGYERQTRMPEPPFLLADRVTGIDAEPGTMGTGTIWTETDV